MRFAYAMGHLWLGLDIVCAYMCVCGFRCVSLRFALTFFFGVCVAYVGVYAHVCACLYGLCVHVYVCALHVHICTHVCTCMCMCVGVCMKNVSLL